MTTETNFNIVTHSNFNIVISAPTDEDSILVMNDTKAQQHIASNSTTTKADLLKTIANTTTISTVNSKNNAICSISGLTLQIQDTPFLNLLNNNEIIEVKIPLSTFFSVLALSEEKQFALNTDILSATVTALFTSIELLHSANTSKGMDTLILQTVGKFHLVQALKIFSLIKSNAVDVATLPRLDISYITHSTLISSFEQPFANYLSLIEEALQSEISYQSNKKVEDIVRKQRLQQMQLDNLKKKEHTTLDSQYEVARKTAHKALKEASIDLLFLNYKKLTTILITAISSKNGAELMSKDIKDKIVVRLNEIIEKVDDANLISQLRIIKDFIVLANSQKVINRVGSAIERASDLHTTSLQKNNALSLKDRLLAMQNKNNSTTNPAKG